MVGQHETNNGSCRYIQSDVASSISQVRKHHLYYQVYNVIVKYHVFRDRETNRLAHEHACFSLLSIVNTFRAEIDF